MTALAKHSTVPASGSNIAMPKRIGEVLLEQGFTTPDDLAKALVRQNNSDANLGEILIADKALTAVNLRRALSQQARLEFDDTPKTDGRAYPFEFSEMLSYGFVPTASTASTLKIAVSNPSHIPNIQKLCSDRNVTPQFILSSLDKIHNCIADMGKSHFSKAAEFACPETHSCRTYIHKGNNISLLVKLGLCCSIIAALGYGEYLLFVIALTTFLGNGVLKFACLIAFLFKRSPSRPPIKKHQKLEKVSILVPVFKETQIVSRLIKRLSELDYPKELLEIFLICEEEDQATQDHIQSCNLPRHIRMLVAPKGRIQTKPRALNYALNFCHGTVIGIYDAEDAPEYDQVYKAVRHLQQSDDRVVCVQARLDFFNQDTNWLAQCFTIEYAMLFRVILQGLQRLDLPIPLGGTSMFIQRDALVKWGQWDAHNVTEDADLGMRLYRKGLRVECLDSTTYEEANYKSGPWIKQRSRWLKGFIMTWLTHMRMPKRVLNDMGLAGFLAFNVLMLGTVVTYLAIPLLLPYWLLTFGVTPPVFDTVPYGALPFMIAVLALGEPFLIVLGMYATKTKKHRSLRKTLFTMFAYWPLASFAAYKALYEVFFAPAYWDKTEHGLNDGDFKDQIAELTLPEWRKAA